MVKENKEVSLTRYRVNGWEVTDEGSIFFGKHDTGTVNIPDGEFPAEQIEAWIKEGKLIVQ